MAPQLQIRFIMRTTLFSLSACAMLVATSLVGCAPGAEDEDSDDWIDEDAEAISVAGSWRPTSAATASADRQFVRYDGATSWDGGRHCGGSLLSGTRGLGDYLRSNFRGVTSYGGYSCRPNTADNSQMSVHGTGRALDVFIPTTGGAADNTKGDEVANWLIANAQSIGVQLVIWDRSIWNASRPAGSKLRGYGGPNPHVDHLHVELNTDGAARRTSWFRGGMTAPTPTPTPTPTPAPMETPPPPPPGGVAPRMRVIASFLNLRMSPSASAAVISVMNCGESVQVVGGPTSGWYNITVNGRRGWASGNFLLPESSFRTSMCGG
jgi:hypothetical protein